MEVHYYEGILEGAFKIRYLDGDEFLLGNFTQGQMDREFEFVASRQGERILFFEQDIPRGSITQQAAAIKEAALRVVRSCMSLCRQSLTISAQAKRLPANYKGRVNFKGKPHGRSHVIFFAFFSQTVCRAGHGMVPTRVTMDKRYFTHDFNSLSFCRRASLAQGRRVHWQVQ